MARVAIIDFGMGNLYSISNACLQVGLEPVITSSYSDINSSQGIILPGVGAFGDAMKKLTQLNLCELLREKAEETTPMLGICLGYQLLFSHSQEFGSYKGLNIIDGEVLPLKGLDGFLESGNKAPEIGWNRIYFEKEQEGSASCNWLVGMESGSYMYFNHSYYVQPADTSIISTTTMYAGLNLCSSILKGNLFACQFHPEKSGRKGLQIYDNFLKQIQTHG